MGRSFPTGPQAEATSHFAHESWDTVSAMNLAPPAVCERYEAMLGDYPEEECARMLIADCDVAKSHPTKEDMDSTSSAAIKAALS